MKEHMMKTQKARQIIKIAGGLDALPKRQEMVTVESLLSAQDKEFIKANGIGQFAVEMGGKYAFVSQICKVPAEATLVRQDAGQHAGSILGIPAVVGG